MTTTVKLHGFSMPGAPSSRNSNSRLFSDGSMSVDTSMLSASLNTLMSTHSMQPDHARMSDFQMTGTSLPTHAFDYNLVSPHTSQSELPGATSPNQVFHPHTIFGHLGFGNNDNNDFALGNDDAMGGDGQEASPERSRSQSSSRSSHLGKAPVSRTRTGRKNSTSGTQDTGGGRPSSVSAQPRGRMWQPPRAQSFQATSRAFAFGLDPHPEGQQTDSIDFKPSFSVPVGSGPLPDMLWNPDSTPNVMPEGFSSYGASVDDATFEELVTPALSNHHLPADESKKQKRRESHNQVEKRRREHINAMIERLGQLLPPDFEQHNNLDSTILDDDEDEPGVEQSSSKKKFFSDQAKRASIAKQAPKDSVQNKGQILSNSVLYIQQLQALSEHQGRRLRYLESLLSEKSVGGVGFVPAQPHLWNNTTSGLGLGLSSRDGGNPGNHNFPKLDDTNLEAMRASPEVEQLSALSGDQTWMSGEVGVNMMGGTQQPVEGGVVAPFTTDSPADRRSISMITSSPESSDKKDTWDAMDFLDDKVEGSHRPSDSDDYSPSNSSEGGRGQGVGGNEYDQMRRHSMQHQVQGQGQGMKQQHDHELQMTLQGMGLDMISGGGVESQGGIHGMGWGSNY